MPGVKRFDRCLRLARPLWVAFVAAGCNGASERLFRDAPEQALESLGAGGISSGSPDAAPEPELSPDAAREPELSPDAAISSAGSGTLASRKDAGAAEPLPPVPMNFVLDDFEDGDGQLSSEGFSGRWRTYSDGTATVTPAVNAPIVPEAGALHVNGTGFTSWGVGASVDLDDASGRRTPVDLSKYRGLSFRARGVGSVEVELVLPATTGTQEIGGTCAGTSCFGHYSARLTLSADYTEQTLQFTAFQQPDWALTAERDLTQVLAINFLSRVNGAPANIDLWLDEVSLLPLSLNPVE
jgi:hypothetical protein